MKKLLYLILLIPSILYAEGITYKTDIKAKRYNSVAKKQLETDFHIEYYEERENIVIFYKEIVKNNALFLTRKQADDLISAIEKYESWHIKAVNKKVKLEKTIKELSVAYCGWKIGQSDWNFQVGNYKYEAIFSSESEKHHQFMLSFTKATSSLNKFISHKPVTLYFEKSEAIKLKNALKKENLASFLVDYKKKKALEDEEFK